MKRLLSNVWNTKDIIQQALTVGFISVTLGAIVPSREGVARIICGLLAILFLGIIVLRRKKNLDE